MFGVQYYKSIAGWVLPIHAKQLFSFTLNLKDFSHGELFLVAEVTWVAHWQLGVEPFYDS
jgi:hypothetical protein